MSASPTISRYGVEYVHWKLEGLPDDVTKVEARIGGTWHPLEHADDGTWRVLVAGPGVDPPAGAAVLRESDRNVLVRVTDSPEIVVRGGGGILLGW